MKKVKVTGSIWTTVNVEFEMEIDDDIDIQENGDIIRNMVYDYDGDYDIDMDELKDSLGWTEMEDINVEEI